MGIKYPVAPGTLLLCDYGAGGFVAPEMVKRRPAVVVSPRLAHRDFLCAVVPLSTTPPAHAVDYVVQIDLAKPLPFPFDAPTMWAKCDMVATVGFARLDLFRGQRGPDGLRKYFHLRLPADDLHRVRLAIMRGLGLNVN